MARNRIKKDDIFIIEGGYKEYFYARKAERKDDKWLFRFFVSDKNYKGGEIMIKGMKSLNNFKEII